jgi:hypothetical protein
MVLGATMWKGFLMVVLLGVQPLERIFDGGFIGRSTIVSDSASQESVPFPHHSVGDCLQNVLFFEEISINLCIKQK